MGDLVPGAVSVADMYPDAIVLAQLSLLHPQFYHFEDTTQVQDKINIKKLVVIIMVIIIMSEFAFFRFRSHNMLTIEEEQHKDEIVELTEEVLDTKGMECDSKISKISEEQLREILEEVRKLRRKRKRLLSTAGDSTEKEEVVVEHPNEEESPYIR